MFNFFTKPKKSIAHYWLIVFLLSLHSCEVKKEETASENILSKTIFTSSVIGEAGSIPGKSIEVLPMPFYMVSSLDCPENESLSKEAILLAKQVGRNKKVQMFPILGMVFTSGENKKIVPLFLPVKPSYQIFKRYDDTFFRVRYDEMLSIVKDWYCSYLGLKNWQFEGWIMEEDIVDTLLECDY